MVQQASDWFVVAVITALALPLVVVRTNRASGPWAALVAGLMVATMLAVVAAVPFPWGPVVVLAGTVVWAVTQSRHNLRASFAGELTVDHGGIALDKGTADLARAGFAPVLAFRTTGRGPSLRSVALLDPSATILARVGWRPGDTTHRTAIVSVFDGGRVFTTPPAVFLPPVSSELAQSLPGASVDERLAQHRAALAWLAERGHRPVVLDANGVAEFCAAQWARGRERADALSWATCAALVFRSLRGGAAPRGPLPARPDAEACVAAWTAGTATEPASP